MKDLIDLKELMADEAVPITVYLTKEEASYLLTQAIEHECNSVSEYVRRKLKALRVI